MSKKILPIYLLMFLAAIASGQQVLPSQDHIDQSVTKMKPLQVADIFDLNLSAKEAYNSSKTGLVYQEQFQSEGAGFIKLYIENFDLKPGDYMEVYNPKTGDVYIYSEKGKIVGTKESPYMISEFWTGTIMGDHIIVSVFSKDANNRSNHYGFDITKVSYGYSEETIERLAQRSPDDNTIFSICGADNKEAIVCYDGTEMYRKGEAVCRLLINGGSLCTGWLIGCEGNVMTNNHCIGSAAAANNTDFLFNYRYTTCAGSTDASSDLVATSATFEFTDGGNDFTLVQLPVNPTATYGYLSLSSAIVTAGERIYIPQHPGGRRKEIAVLTDTDPLPGGFAQVSSSSNARVEYLCDTEGGSSGSPVLRFADNLVVSIHNTGGCPNGSGARSNEMISILNAQGLMPNCGVDDPNPASPQVGFQSGAMSTAEGTDCSFTDVNISVNLNQAATQNADVTFSVNGSGSATQGTDFDLQTTNITFPAGSTTSQNMTVRIYNDALVEGDETVVIDLSVNANGGDAGENPSLNSITITITDDDIATSGGTQQVIFSEDFQADYSTTWASIDEDGDSNVWIPLTGVTYTGITGNFPGSESDGTVLGNGGNFSPDNYFYHVTPFVVPNNTSNVNFNFGIGGFQDTEPYEVYFTTDISSATAVQTGTLIDSGTTLSGNGVIRDIDVSSLNNVTGYFVVRHVSPGVGTSGIILLDNITITATVFADIQTGVNNGTTHDQLMLPGNGSIHTSDAASGDVMMDIVNNDAHDYGCIDVAIARAGTGGTVYNGSTAPDLAVDKTFYINPTNAASSGDVTITFYFTEAEIAGWEAATGGAYSRTDLHVLRDDAGPITFAPDNTINATETTTLTIGSFGVGGSGVTFTGTFTGLSGGFILAPLSVLSTSDVSLDQADISLYPNPTAGNINIGINGNIELPDNYEVFNVLGQKVISKEINSDQDLVIDATALQTGVYFVKISDKNSSTTLQFVRK
ncbi:MAG: trypsin-like peptidase domain-containing protein [Flavobacteriaceae bacterium]|nr:trypsin-like peptidase domain-containing protein [Flavobacteriaceae bacterium]